jgi:hypothetical protein
MAYRSIISYDARLGDAGPLWDDEDGAVLREFADDVRGDAGGERNAISGICERRAS